LQLVQPDGVYVQTLAFTTAHQIRSAYDTLYVVTARLLSLDLWTADQNLVNALGSAAPWVRWIGDYPVHHDGRGAL
jgi:predicted nucleic acid-binding protein